MDKIHDHDAVHRTRGIAAEPPTAEDRDITVNLLLTVAEEPEEAVGS